MIGHVPPRGGYLLLAPSLLLTPSATNVTPTPIKMGRTIVKVTFGNFQCQHITLYLADSGGLGFGQYSSFGKSESGFGLGGTGRVQWAF